MAKTTKISDSGNRREGSAVVVTPAGRKRTSRHAHRLLPATYVADGSRMASLREMVDPRIPTKPIHTLSGQELTDLVAQRFESSREDFRIRMLGVPGIIDKPRAIREIRAGSHIGAHLIDIEKRMIRFLAEKELDKQNGRSR